MADRETKTGGVVYVSSGEIPTLYSNYQWVATTPHEVIVMFCMVQVQPTPEGDEAEKNFEARGKLQVIMSPPVARGLLGALADQLGMTIQPKPTEPGNVSADGQ